VPFDVLRIKPEQRRWLPISPTIYHDGTGRRHVNGVSLCWWTGALVICWHPRPRRVPGSLTWAQFSESMQAVEDAYRDALTGREAGFPPKPRPRPFLGDALDREQQSDNG
jgi:hypothetical protein